MKLRDVVILTDAATVTGGAEKVALQTARMLDSEGVSVHLFSAGEEDGMPLPSGIHVEAIGGPLLRDGRRTMSRALEGVWSSQAYRRLSSLLSNLDPARTIVHVHSWASGLSPSVFGAAGDMGFPIVITAHDYALACPNSCKFLFRRQEVCDKSAMSMSCLLADCDRDDRLVKMFRVLRFGRQTRALTALKPTIVFVSGFQREVLAPLIPFEYRGCTIANPVTVMRGTTESFSKDAPFLFVGRVTEEKGADIFCEACARLGSRGVVLGDGHERMRLQSEYPEIEFRGWCQPSEVEEEMRRAKALVFPSRWYEAAPLTPVEAQLAAALPCIVSDVTAAVDDVIDQETGFVFQSGSVESLVGKMRRLADPEIELRMRNRISVRQEQIANEHEGRKYRLSIMKLYESLLSSAGVAGEEDVPRASE